MEVGGAIASINTPLRLLAEVLFLDEFDVKVDILNFGELLFATVEFSYCSVFTD